LDVATASQSACGVIPPRINVGTPVIAEKERASELPEHIGVER